jgi:iron complex transport system substrate-binding protein
VARCRLIPLLFPVLLACGRTPDRTAVTAFTWHDDWDRTVTLAAPARRIVSLSPATTELLFALELGDRVVGRTHWCDHPAAAASVPDLGDGLGPNVEAVAATMPDLVLLYASEGNRAALGRFDALGITTLVLRLDRVEDLRRAAIAIGKLTGTRAVAERFLVRFDSATAAASRAAATGRPRVYVDVEPNPPITVGEGSYLTQVVELAGGQNVFSDIEASSATVSLEAVVARDPDVILTLGAARAAADLARRPGWGALRAVREGRIIAVDASLFGRPSPRLPAAVAQLAARLGAGR